MSLFNGIKWPYATMQQLNLDWLLTEIKRVMGFFPESGDPGTVLMKTEEGAAWEELPAIDININGVPEDTELTDTDKLIFYDISASANRKITAPNLLNSMMSNGTPLMDGTGSAGTSKKPARYDHRHPTDTTRQAALSGVQMNAVNSGAPANCFDSNGVLKPANGGHVRAHWGDYEAVSFPFTPSADGVVTVDGYPANGQEEMVIYIQDSDEQSVLTIDTQVGHRGTGSFPVKAGVTYAVTYSQNVLATHYGYRALY
jgi:hypothetical protein